VAALQDATFEAEKGEVHALLGENGAGKSTFIKILAGAQRPDGGTIEIEGTAVGRLNPGRARALGVGAVFQELSLVPDVDVARNIWLESEPHTPVGTLAARQMRRRSEALLEELGFPALPVDEPVRNLPIAQRQLIEIAKAMARQPKILILDEPTSALAPNEVSLVMALMRRHTEAGGLCIFISHRLSEVREVADRATIFRNGTDVITLRPDSEDDDTIISHIIGRRIDQLFPPTTTLADPPLVLSARGLGVADKLHDVDFDIHAGEILGVGGLQGQGQRELFLRIFGIMKGGGTIEIGGREARIRSPHDALSEGVGLALIPEDRQHEGLLLSKSVRTNLTLTRLGQISRFGFLRRSAERKLSQKLITDLEIAAARDTLPVDSLSGGNQQKVVIGKFLSSSVQVLLCYDPTRGVDVGARHAIFELMHELAAEGKAILFFSTDNSELINVAHRVVVLAGGSVSAMLEREALSETSIVRAALAGKAKEVVA
jgi:ribose transport system ATP-binding protein